MHDGSAIVGRLFARAARSLRVVFAIGFDSPELAEVFAWRHFSSPRA